MTPEYMIVLAMFHAVVALAGASANLFVTHHRTTATAQRDLSGLRAALAAELGEMQTLYKDNLDSIFAGRDALASCRMFSVIYRANLTRLHLLAASDVAAIVAAYAMSERIEAFAAAHCRAHGANAFSMSKERPFAAALVALYEKGVAAAERAARVLEPSPERRSEAMAAEAAPRLAAA